MDYSTLLLEFIDGTLEGPDELALFNALSSNEELRAEFKHLLAISSSVRNDITPFIPPTSSTQHIFSQLGFTPPLPAPVAITTSTSALQAASTAASSTAVVAGAAKTAVWNIRRFLPAFTSAILASMTTAAFFLWMNTGDSVPSNSVAHAPRTPSLDRIVAHNMGTGASGVASPVQSALPQEPREVVRYVYIPQPTAVTSQETVAQASSKPDAEAEHNERPVVEPVVHAYALTPQFAVRDMSRPDIRSVDAMPESPLSNDSWSKLPDAALTIELRDNVSTSFPNATVDPSSSSWWNNKSVTVLYSLSELQSVGVEFGQEAFFQRFEARDASGRRFQYEQNPVLQWAGVAYRFSISEIGAFNPFGQVTLGGTRVGYLGKTMVGVNYTPNPSLRLTAGIEGSLLYYPVQGSMYRSGKLGFTYGIGFTF